MKLIFSTLMLLTLASSAEAYVYDCVAVSLQDHSQSPVKFQIDYGFHDTIVTFERKIAWDPGALNFRVIYSNSSRTSSLVVGLSNPGPNAQLLELSFDGRTKVRGTLKAGDQSAPMGKMGKHLTYAVECAQR